MAIARKTIMAALECVLCPEPFRSASFFVKSKTGKVTVIRATRRHKPSKRDWQTEIVLTIGGPNYAERELIARRRRKGWDVCSPFLREYPQKK